MNTLISVTVLVSALMFGASHVAMAASFGTAQPGPTAVSSGKSNIGTAAEATEADCTKQGGTVETGKDGAKRCNTANRTPRMCVIYKPGHEGDYRYCSQSVPWP